MPPLARNEAARLQEDEDLVLAYVELILGGMDEAEIGALWDELVRAKCTASSRRNQPVGTVLRVLVIEHLVDHIPARRVLRKGPEASAVRPPPIGSRRLKRRRADAPALRSARD